MKKILQIMPVPDNIAIGDMSQDISTGEIYCDEIGKNGDRRTCLLALVEEDGYQRVVPLVWDFEMRSFDTTDDITSDDYAIAAVSRDFLRTNSWDDVFYENIKMLKALKK